MALGCIPESRPEIIDEIARRKTCFVFFLKFFTQKPLQGEIALKDKTWHDILRKDIPWFPQIDANACIGCELCFVSCGREVFEMQNKKAVAVNPYNCMVGCSTCATVCPVNTISFPKKDMIRKIEREHKIFKAVHEEAAQKKKKFDAVKARAAAEDRIARITSGVNFEIAGEFGDKQFLLKLCDMVKNHPIDIVNLQLDTPSLSEMAKGTPSFMKFEIISVSQNDILEILPLIRTLIRNNGFVIINEKIV